MVVNIRKKIIRPLYPISLVVLGLAFAFHFGEIRGTVAVSSDREESHENYFQAGEDWGEQGLIGPLGAVAGESIGGDISGAKNLTGEDINQDNNIPDDTGALDNPEDLSGEPVVAGEEVVIPPEPPQDPADDAEADPEDKNTILPDDPQENAGGTEDNSGSGQDLGGL